MSDSEYRKISEKELKDILKKHALWVTSEGEKGIRANLSEADLSGVDLSTANLSKANLSRVDLSRADISGANLIEANLSGAALIGANFFKANLSSANFSSAGLFLTNFLSANLSKANLAYASLAYTIFADTNLTGTIGLNSCIYQGPSAIDHRTIIKSGGLPDSFLRGCGLPDALIEYYPSLLNKAIEFYSCFISYSSIDEEFTKRLYADLQANGVRCWYAPEDLKIGAKTRSAIDQAIRLHDKLLIVLSKDSVDSEWVEYEVESALDKEKNGKTKLFPIRIDDAVMESEATWASHIKRTRHIGDFKDWKDHDSYQKAFDRLLRDLKESKTKE